MIEVHNNIELRTNKKTEGLVFAARYLVQLNFTFDLIVWSGEFRGKSPFCIRRDTIEKFCQEFSKMHFNLSGKTKIEDEDSTSFIEFQIESNGRLNVCGQVGSAQNDHSMKFTFHTDQTCIPFFVEDFTLLLKKVP